MPDAPTPTQLPMPSALLVDDARLEQIYAELRSLIRELDPTLSDDDVEAALARVIYYAERERSLKNLGNEPPRSPTTPPKKKKPGK